MSLREFLVSALLTFFSVSSLTGQEADCLCPELDPAQRGLHVTRNCPAEPPKWIQTWDVCRQKGLKITWTGICCGPFNECDPEPLGDPTFGSLGNSCEFFTAWMGKSCGLWDFCKEGDEQSFRLLCDPCPQEVSGGYPPPYIPTLVPDGSPIILALEDHGLRLTSVDQGVQFDLDGDGIPEQVSWTDAGTFQGFLGLDRNQNGMIDNGLELFGNFTPQPPSSDPNGFEALLVFDENQDGLIDPRDPIYGDLLVWIDSSHDGISNPEELQTLTLLGVKSIDLNYHESRKKDRYGNEFRYRSRVIYDNKKRRFAYDVFLQFEGVQ